jgi:trypsin
VYKIRLLPTVLLPESINKIPHLSLPTTLTTTNLTKMRPQITYAATLTFVCGAQAIVGGNEASIQDLPFIVSVGRTSPMCSGVLISPTAVLTDPECIEQGSTTTLRVRAGSLRRDSGGVVAKVYKVDRHQGYVSGSPTDRIAVLHLESAFPASSGSRKIEGAPLYSQETTPGTKLVAGGWGVTSYGAQSVPSTLRKVTIEAKDLAVCQQQHPDLELGPESMCAGVNGGGKGPCSGDNGGPLVNEAGQVVGLIQSPYGGCAQPDAFSIATNLDEYEAWIAERVLDLPR